MGFKRKTNYSNCPACDEFITMTKKVKHGKKRYAISCFTPGCKHNKQGPVFGQTIAKTWDAWKTLIDKA